MMRRDVVSSNSGFILVWVLAIVMVFLGWSSRVMHQYTAMLKAYQRQKVVQERLDCEALMVKHFQNTSTPFTHQGPNLTFMATRHDKKIHVRVHGTVNLEYTYGIMDDESLVLIDTEE